jgi:hypothetical protein
MTGQKKKQEPRHETQEKFYQLFKFFHFASLFLNYTSKKYQLGFIYSKSKGLGALATARVRSWLKLHLVGWLFFFKLR